MSLQVNPAVFARRLSTAAAAGPGRLAYKVYVDAAKLRAALPPIVVLHGYLGSKANWSSTCARLLRALAGARKLIAVDLRNHGDSFHDPEHTYPAMTRDVRDLLAAVGGAGPVSFIGHSMGGKVAMSYALTYVGLMMMMGPETVRQMVVVDIAPNRSPKSKYLNFMVEALSAVNLPKNVEKMTARDIVNKQLKGMIEDQGMREFFLMSLDIDEKGKKDDEPKIFEFFPKAEVVYIQDAGHNIHMDKPQDFDGFVLSYLNRQ